MRLYDISIQEIKKLKQREQTFSRLERVSRLERSAMGWTCGKQVGRKAIKGAWGLTVVGDIERKANVALEVNCGEGL